VRAGAECVAVSNFLAVGNECHRDPKEPFMKTMMFALLVLSQMSVFAYQSADQDRVKRIVNFDANFLAPEDAREIIFPLYSRVLRALQSRDMNSLSRLVHPVKGVRFAPYAFLESATDLRFSAGAIHRAFADQRKRIWGSYDGSGYPIRLSFQEYYQKFVYNRDFAQVARISYNSGPGHQGNTVDNSRKEFPRAIIVEAYDPGDGESNNWTSLRLVFEQQGGAWYLVYIVHDEWTI
jgi:hypothetical protein